MRTKACKVSIFIDESPLPVAELNTPVQFDIDTRKLTDGEHILKIVSKAPAGREGIRTIPFTVRNGPSITVEGLKENEKVDGVLPILIHAYDKGRQQTFMIEGSETPHSIPSWIWVLLIAFVAWAMFYGISNFSI